MLIQNLYYDYINNRKFLFIKYIAIVCLTFPAETLVISRMYSKLFNNIKENNDSNHYITILIIIISWLVIIYFFYLKSDIRAKIIPDYLSYIRSKIFSKTIEFYKNNYKDIKIGKFISRLLGLSRMLKNIMVDILDNIFPLALAIFIINIYFFYLNSTIGIISMIGFIIIIAIIVLVAPHFIKTAAHKENKFNDMTEKLHDSFSNLMNVYLNNQDFQEITKNKNIENNQSKLLKQELLNIKNVVLYLSITSAIIFGVIIYTSYSLFNTKQISSEVFINILIILIGYFSYLIRISKLTPELLAKIGIVKNSELFLNNILSRQEKQLTSDDYNNGSISFKNVDFKYPGSKRNIFDKFNLEINQNEKVVIMGTSGSGKTTLIKLLLRMYSVNKGQILINNKDIKLIDLNILRQKINYINQRTNLFDNSILNNIKYGNQVDDSSIINMLEQYNLKDIYKGLEQGIYDEAGVNGTNLSLGMQKLTMIMRGLLKGGDIVIYDEPLAGLDKSTRAKIIKLIMENSINKTLIIISHNKDFTSHVNRVIDLNDINKKY